MNNIQHFGQNIEQTTKVSSLRPELFVFHGYSFLRTSSTVIEVWNPCACENCNAEIAINSFFVRTGKLEDQDILRHGLKLSKKKQPPRGIRVHTSAPFLCEPCKDRWLKGEALEKLQ